MKMIDDHANVLKLYIRTLFKLIIYGECDSQIATYLPFDIYKTEIIIMWY